AWLAREQVDGPLRQFECVIEARYRGQNHEIRVPMPTPDAEDGLSTFIAAFQAAYQKEYGSVVETRPVEVVNCRVRASGAVPKAKFAPMPPGGAVEDALIGERDMYCGPTDGWRKTRIFARGKLPVGQAV